MSHEISHGLKESVFCLLGILCIFNTDDYECAGCIKRTGLIIRKRHQFFLCHIIINRVAHHYAAAEGYFTEVLFFDGTIFNFHIFRKLVAESDSLKIKWI